MQSESAKSKHNSVLTEGPLQVSEVATGLGTTQSRWRVTAPCESPSMHAGEHFPSSFQSLHFGGEAAAAGGFS
jgi:hypothetical protein